MAVIKVVTLARSISEIADVLEGNPTNTSAADGLRACAGWLIEALDALAKEEE